MTIPPTVHGMATCDILKLGVNHVTAAKSSTADHTCPKKGEAMRTPTPEELGEIASCFSSIGFRINYPHALRLGKLGTAKEVRAALAKTTDLDKAMGSTALVAATEKILVTPKEESNVRAEEAVRLDIPTEA